MPCVLFTLWYFGYTLSVVCNWTLVFLKRRLNTPNALFSYELSTWMYILEYSLFSTRLHVHQRMNANGNWHQMIYFPETRIQWDTVFDGGALYTLCYSFVQCTATLTLCITVSWSRYGAIFCVLGHLAMSSLLHCPEPTAAHYPSLGAEAPYPQSGSPFPRIRAHYFPMVQNTPSPIVTEKGGQTNSKGGGEVKG